jgi:hypothetical protein
VKQITEIFFGVDRDSVASWIDRFNTGGATSLEHNVRPGGDPGLDDEEQAKLRWLFKRFPNRPSHVRRNWKSSPESQPAGKPFAGMRNGLDNLGSDSGVIFGKSVTTRRFARLKLN